MDSNYAVGFLIIALLLGGVFLFARRPVGTKYQSIPQVTGQQQNSGNIRLVMEGEEPRRYRNKEIRQIEYNEDNLPVKIIITRDYAIT